METVRIRLQINRDAAVRAGRDQYGPTIVSVDVAALSVDEREELLRCPIQNGISEPSWLTSADQRIAARSDLNNLPAVANASTDSVRTILAARRGIIVALGVAVDTQVEAWIQAALAVPDEDWIKDFPQHCEIQVPHNPSSNAYSNYHNRQRVTEDTRIVERCQRLEPIAAERTAAKKLARQKEIDEGVFFRAQKTEARKAWIAEHGSPHLQRLAAAGIEHANRYENERLAMERPDWRWLTDDMSTNEPDDDCPPEALDLFDAVACDTSITSPQLRLISNDDERFYAVLAEFLGRTIVTKQSVEVE